jgi:heat shock protein HtpX
MALSDYHSSALDWRGQLQRNQRKTQAVIVCFVLIYLCLGFLTDMLLLQYLYPGLPIGQAFNALVSFHAIPYATLSMVGVAIVSLLVTYSMYDRIMLMGTDYHEITPETAETLQERQLYNVVEEMKVSSGLKFMPRVFIIEANYMNAFASGYSEKSAMVAITRGLIEKLDRAELQAVMAHELSHIRHLDIKLTLMVGILSNVLLILIDVLFYSIVYGRERREDSRLLVVIVLLRYVLPLITLMLALFLSRTREFMADSGAVELMRDNIPMARALMKISQDHEKNAEEYSEEYGNTAHEEVRQASYLFDPSSLNPVRTLNNLFSTHPSLDQRLKALGFTKKGD